MWRRVAAACVLTLALLAPSPDRAMDLPSYDLVSLAYMSTDIVIASVTEETAGANGSRLIATVESVLYGSALRPGDKLDTLTSFLQFFHPLAGYRVILFLNSEPHQYAFPYERLKTPFAVVPDGALLIDAYGHVHRYTQMMNPGGYTAQGWPVILLPGTKREPTPEDDLKLPSLDEKRAELAKALAEVAPVRTLLKRPARPDDVPAVLHLIDRTSADESDCPLRMAKAIKEEAEHQIFTLNDPELTLSAYVKSGGDFPTWQYFFDLRTLPGGPWDRKAEAARVHFLADILLDDSRDLVTRMGAANVIRADYTFNMSLPSEGLQAAEAIFRDNKEDPILRALALALLLPSDTLGTIGNQKRVPAASYVHEAQAIYRALPRGVEYDSLRFAIETQLLGVSDADYDALHSSSGNEPYLIGTVTPYACDPESAAGPVFYAERRARREFANQYWSFYNANKRFLVDSGFVLVGVANGREFRLPPPKDFEGFDSATGTHLDEFRLSDLAGVPPGDYWLTWRLSLSDGSLNRGYPARITIGNGSGERQVTVDEANTPKVLPRWPW